jgi:uncharacterized caspase-like protein
LLARLGLPCALLAMLVLSARAQVPGRDNAAAETWAVLIGVSRYAHLPESDWLKGADADARALARFLESPRGGSVPSDHVQVLVNEQATVSNIRLALDRLIRSTRHGDVAWIFFAGHGKVEWYGGGEVGYLLASDSDPRVLNATALPMDEMRRYVDVNLRQADQVLLVTDACHAGRLGPEGESARILGTVNERISEIGERSGVLNLMACRRDEKAVEDPRLGGHGVLTACLLQALDGAGTYSSDDVVRVEDVLEYVMRKVPELTGGRQHPRYGTNYSDEFPLAWLRRPGPRLDLPAPRRQSGRTATLRVEGARAGEEVYLVRGGEQRTVGRAIDDGNVLVVEGLAPGRCELVSVMNGTVKRWKIDLEPGLDTFDLREGGLR